jgi:hypothetical protein
MALLAICVVALGVRVGYTLGWQQVDEIGGDPYYYHRGAILLVEGEGFVHPYAFDQGVVTPGADHPPGYILVLALPTILGFRTLLEHQLFTCLLGTGTVVLLALVGRRIAGRRAGLIAAGLGALHPAIWLNDASLMSETLALLCGVAVMLAAYYAWDGPSWRRFALVGAAVGLASLARAEAILLAGLVAIPLAAWAPGLAGWRQRTGRLAVATAATLLVIAPWVGANLVRFERPATLSTQLGPTLEAANCDQTYHGPLLGSWTLECASNHAGVERSVLDGRTRANALEYIGDNAGRVPVVMGARLARTFGLFDAEGQLRFDAFSDQRPVPASRAALWSYCALAAASVVGVVILRRRGVPSFPVTSAIVAVAITVVLIYGSTRFRAPAEPAFVLLASVAVDALVRRWRRDHAPGSAGEGSTRGSSEGSTGESTMAATPSR